MALFEWHDGMSVGAHLIDLNPRALMAISNELHDVLEVGQAVITSWSTAPHTSRSYRKILRSNEPG